MRTVEAIYNQPWAILPDRLETMIAVAKRENDIEALSTKLGRPLDNTRTVETVGDTAIVPVTGSIFRYANLFTEVSGATSTEVLAKDIGRAFDNPSVRNVVLEINSGGGQADGIADLAASIRDGSRRTGKSVVAFVDGTAASAAYWIASAADHIVASKTAMVGSIGAVLTVRRGTDDGRIEFVSSVSPKKRPNVETPEGRGQLQKWADDIGRVFLEDVARYRGVDFETARTEFGGGDMFIAHEALRRGMIDEIGTLDGLLTNLKGE